MKGDQREDEKASRGDSSVPDLNTTNSAGWMAHCVNLPFLPQAKNIDINFSILSLLKGYEDAVKNGDQASATEDFNKIQDKMKEQFGPACYIPMSHARQSAHHDVIGVQR